MPARGVVIDLDGTLLDTIPDLAAGVNAMLADLGRAPLSVDRVACYVGKGVEALVHRALSGRLDGHAEPALFAAGYPSFITHYERENGRHSKPFPGVLEGLDAMRQAGLRLACVTNKPMAFTAPLLERSGLAGYFDAMVGGDTLSKRKPDPLPMRYACEQLRCPPHLVLAIGDSLNDALAARAAGMPVLAVPYGYNEGRDVRSLDVDGIVDSLAEAARWIEPV
ncbi:MAG: phosphoglycolate phosphatase [Burkholderiaceae bacterium]|nr:phosphoglycolate phosphatase [Burkholderiaceae bacterium]